jgi:hypothetical protein
MKLTLFKKMILGKREEPSSDRKIMQQVASVENMVPSEKYLFHGKVSLNSSEKFVPEKLRYFMQLLFDPQALAETLYISPFYFEGPTAMEMLQNFFCTCKSKRSCSDPHSAHTISIRHWMHQRMQV